MTAPTNGKGAAVERTPRRFPSEKNVPASSAPGNSDSVRHLVRCRDGVLLYELKRGASTSFEVVAPNGDCWCYKLLYSAESKWSRLVGKTEGAE
jgi:hypothetical protein